ncbi:recombinase family protein [Pedobacter gandavensis]|uniref:recombinase family protein n=1 Tax=Pedobacter gandavensis TaxID=2679963 RepID=UPI00247A9B48|nr:recombinase family protein [Pedobacter gandavensis]WGQ12602.1 recombinase family protein [Pedobacter gandavensis]
MITANLYVRVSTDEQAEKGYSQRNQEEVLRRYCEIKSIIVGTVYFEDHSAKTFVRPVWNKLLVDLRKHKGKTDVILFTKWDRFSRNTGDAYHMINLLRKFGVEPQAIEQPLDLAVPENKMMLAFYLAAPEVENDRRAINVFEGMRRARKEGRWMASAPLGYMNLTSETGKKYIAPKEPVAEIIRWAFNELSSGKYAVDQIWRAALSRGLKVGRNHFRKMIQNPVYCGKIVISKYKDEDEYWVDGKHKALISDALFFQVQELVEGKKRVLGPTKFVSPDMLPLRGFLKCPKCSRMLSGSASKGRGQNYYHYYHCSSSCKTRYKAIEANTLFEEELSKITVTEGYEDFYVQCMLEKFRAFYDDGQESQRALLNKIKEQTNKITEARDFLMSGVFSGTDFQAIKLQCEKEIRILESRLPLVSLQTKKVEADLSLCISNLKSTLNTYRTRDIAAKRKIIGSIYPENLVFDGLQHRTTRMNEIASNITLITKKLKGKKKWSKSELSDLTTWVGPAGLEPATKRL